MLNTWSLDRGSYRQYGFQTARIEQTFEAARRSLDRLTRLRRGWDSLNPEARGLGRQTEIIAETAIAGAYARDLARMMPGTCRGLICVPRWDDELATIRRELDEATAWARSAGIPWPQS